MKPAYEIKILNEKGIMYPYPATEGSAGYDLKACIDEKLTILPGETAVIPTGIAIHIKDKGIMGMLIPRSSLGMRGLILLNTIGIIDSDYQGEIKVSLWNTGASNDIFVIESGERICQLIFTQIIQPSFKEVEEFTEKTMRSINGFGHTGRR
jgi:dUTP pyrophosphatase